MIRTETNGSFFEITIDRPEAMNALSPEMLADLRAALIRYRDDPDLRVAIITGAGERAFSSGADLGRMREGASEPQPDDDLAGGLGLTKPLVGAINGHCLAGGLGVALLCDVRIASENATFGCMGTARGILPGLGQTVRLPHVVGLGNALWLLLSAERIPASEALRIGLVNRVVPPGEALTAAREWAAILASRAPLALRATKQSTLEGLELPLADALANEETLAAPLMATADAAEGLRAFAERRPADFLGR